MVEAVAPKYSVTYDAGIVNVYHADRGQGLPRHEHSYSHLTMCHAGSCLIRKEGVEKIITKNVIKKAGDNPQLFSFDVATTWLDYRGLTRFQIVGLASSMARTTLVMLFLF